MKKIFVLLMLTILIFTGCKPVPDDEFDDNVIDSVLVEKDTVEEDARITAKISYINSEIPIDAEIKKFSVSEFYTYKFDGCFVPKLDAFYDVLPVLKDENIKINTDNEGRIVSPVNYSSGEMLVYVSDRFARIKIRPHFASEDRIDNEYSNDDEFVFSKKYDEVEKLAMDSAKKLCDNHTLKISSVRRFGKYTKENYYIFTFDLVYDNVTFSPYGRKVEIGKDNEGYSEYIALGGGSNISIYIDEQGISELYWSITNVKKDEQVVLMDFDNLLNRFSQQVTLYSMNNFADFETNANQTIKEGSVKPYTIDKIEMVYALDFISVKDLDKTKAIYTPCWKFISKNSKGQERYTIINAINGDILTTSF